VTTINRTDYKIINREPTTVKLNWLERELPDPEQQRAYARERVIVAVTEALQEAMDDANLRRSDLAELLGKTKGHISQVLNGHRNMTLSTVGDVLWACGKELDDLIVSPLGELDCSVDEAIDWGIEAKDNQGTWFFEALPIPAAERISVTGSWDIKNFSDVAGPQEEEIVANADLATAA
jgi:transcriptional regulator with XRE-family HTH domain